MYKIGDFSKIVDIPVRTLRYYAECGVLLPNEIDKFTGYKYYSNQNVIDAELIKLLKSLDFTLDEIKKYKSNLNDEILEKKKKEIKEKIYLLKLKYEKIIYMQQQLNTNEWNLDTNETEKIIRRKYEKRGIRKNI